MTIAEQEAELERLIHDYIAGRKEAKVEAAHEDRKKGKLDQEGLEARLQNLEEEYAIAAWIEDAGRRSSQIRIATHLAKAIHPDSGASSLRAAGAAESTWCGTPPGVESTDMSGNAAALDVNGFLSIRVAGRSVGERLMADDPALSEVLRRLGLDARSLKDACASTFGASHPEADTWAKQVYFVTGEDAYHLLVPLYPSALVHEVHGLVREARFGEEAKIARQARREGALHARGLVEYPHLALQMFGSGKPQNVSLLTNARRGEAYHFPSHPPTWQADRVRAPWGVRSVFDGVYPRLVWREVRELADFLNREDRNNLALRERRAEGIRSLTDALISLELSLAGLEGGWSGDERCLLADHERLWLDPVRAEGDEAFAAERERGEWRHEVAARFARWLNAELAKSGLPVGDAEHRAWRDEALEVLGGVLDARETEGSHAVAG